ncbi:MAG: hypothetical protein LBU76_00750 [Azoarcus sp.]|jgi:hypothetical protein|nr:hypothetical protein [Azoarcus sp.]
MGYGFKAINNGSVLQINESDQAYVLSQKVTVATAWDGLALWGPTQVYSGGATIHASDHALFAFRSDTPNVPCSIHNLHAGGGVWRVVACSGGNRPASVTIYVLEPIGATALAAERYGMRVFDAAGRVVFSTGKSLCRFQDWRNYDGMSGTAFVGSSLSYTKRPAVIPVQYSEVQRPLYLFGGMMMFFSTVAGLSFSGNAVNTGGEVTCRPLGAMQSPFPPLGQRRLVRAQAMFAVADASKW